MIFQLSWTPAQNCIFRWILYPPGMQFQSACELVVERCLPGDAFINHYITRVLRRAPKRFSRTSINRKVLGLGYGMQVPESFSHVAEMGLGTELQTCFCGGFVLSSRNCLSICLSICLRICELKYLQLLAMSHGQVVESLGTLESGGM